MKTKHRRQLKENGLAHTVTVAARALQENGRTLVIGVVIVVLGGLVVAGIGRGDRRSEDAANVLLADAMVTLATQVVPLTQEDATGLPAAARLGAAGTFASDEDRLNAARPKLEAVVATYSDTSAGQTATYHLASTLALLGLQGEAIEQFNAVLVQAGTESLYGRMALLGRADAEVRVGRLDEAVTSWRELVDASEASDLPKDAILMELGRAYEVRGDLDDARATFTRIIDEYPTSLYSAEARRALDSLPS
jgi:TolA-binding protein